MSQHVVIDSRDMSPSVVHPSVRPDCHHCTKHQPETAVHATVHIAIDPEALARTVEKELLRRNQRHGRPTPWTHAPDPTTQPTTVAEHAPAAVPHGVALEARTS